MDEEEDGDEVYKDVEVDFDNMEFKTEPDKKNETQPDDKNKTDASWVHIDNKISTNISVIGMDDNNKEVDVSKPVVETKDVIVKVKRETIFYDPYNRNPLHAGANLSLYVELLKLRDHFHPTVQLFADNIYSGIDTNFKYTL